MSEPTTRTAPERVNETYRQREEFFARQRSDDLRAVLGDAAGRRFMAWLVFGHCGLNKSVATPDLNLMQRLEGRRQVALELEREAMRVAPDLYLHVEALRLELLAEELELQRLEQIEKEKDAHG